MQDEKEGILMKRAREARSGGFTLVELLIVIVIIGIIAGMMMISAGAATDNADAAKIVNDLRSAKSASLLMFLDEHEWPSEASAADAAKSLDRYADRPMFDGPERRYDIHIVDVSLDVGGGTKLERAMLGIKPAADAFHGSVIKRVKKSAPSTGVFMSDAPPFGVTGLQSGYVYMYMK
jgi:general secretion pathway protein G